MFFLASSNGTLLDLVPPLCTQACQVTSSSFNNCEYGTCICTEDNANALEGCISCLYALSPTPDIYDAAQGIFAGFEDTCSPALTFSLNVDPNPSSSTASPADTSTTPVSPTSTLVSQTSTLSAKSITTTIAAVPSQTAQLTLNDKQICRAVLRKTIMPSGDRKSKFSADTRPCSQPGWKLIGFITFVISILTIHVY